MSKRARTLLVSAIALLALAALLVVLLLLPDTSGNGDTETTTTVPDTTVVLVDKDSEVTVSSVTVTLPEETYTVIPDGNGDMVVKGYEGLPSYTAGYESLTDALLGFGAYRMITDSPEHPEDFGFSEDTASTAALTVKYSDETDFSFEIGDLAPSGEGYYLRKADSAAIYMVDTTFVSTVTPESTYFLSTAPLTAPSVDEDDEELVVRDVTLSGSVRPEPLMFQISTEVPEDGQQAQMLTGFYLTKPYVRNVKSGTNMLSASSYYGFSANSIVQVKPTTADLKKYGLTDPYSQCVVNLSVKKTTTELNSETGKETTSISFHSTFEYTLKLGNETEDGDRYAVLYTEDEMIPLVYTVTPSSLVWAEAQYDDIADTLLFFTYIYQVEEMTVTMDNTSTTFDLTHDSDADERDDQLTVISNGKKYDTADFRTLYTKLMQIERNGSIDAKPTGEPALSIDIVTNTSVAHTGWIKFYQYSAGKYAVLHDTNELYLVDAKDVEEFMTDYHKYLNGEDL